MQVGSSEHGMGHHAMKVRAAILHKSATADVPSRAERMVARHDADGDGKLSVSEMRDTKLGSKMSVDRFAKLDKNGDGMLEAGELKIGRGKGHAHAYGHMKQAAGAESAVRAAMADYLVSKTDEGAASDVAGRVMDRLDMDKNGGLNSEEIAGTRLAEMIGGEFYQLDGDKSGTLDKVELADFITRTLLGGAPPAVDDEQTPDEIAPVADASGDAAPVEQEESAAMPGLTDASAAAERDTSFGSGAADYANQVNAAFETALEMLRTANSAPGYNSVNKLYGEVKSILEPA